MDLGASRHYVAPAMEFLLILSAMLSAVTGAFTGGRAPEARPHHAAASAEVAMVAQPAAVSPARIRIAAPDSFSPAPLLDSHPAVFLAPPASAPLYADRPIE